MAHSSESERLVNGMSSILEEDNGEHGELLVRNEGQAGSAPDKHDDRSSKDIEPASQEGTYVSTPSSIAKLDVDDSKKDEDVSKSVTFAENIEVYDLNSKAATPITVSLDTPVHDVDLPHSVIDSSSDVPNDSAAVLTVVGESCLADSTSVHKGSVASRPAELTLSSQAETKDKSSASETAPQEGEHTGHRHFDVSNVDESELRRQIEIENKENDLEAAKLDLENRPLLEKIPNAFGDNFSEQNTHRANQDTIGPLENPTFLKMLNYSVSQAVEDDAFGGVSCLDLENIGGTQSPADMDGGWAWVVLFAAFFSLSLTGATMFAAGVLMSAILEQIENDLTKASWIGAAHLSVTCMSGPFVGIILNRLGARLTAFIAGLVLSLGLFAAAFVSSIVGLIFTHGLIAGLGSGFILNTMFVIVGQYFNRYRGLACGVLATGSGAGMLAGGSLLMALFNSFGLSGTYLLWSGVTLHSVIFAMLLRPSPEERIRAEEKQMANVTTLTKEQEFQSDLNSMMSGLNSLYGGDQHSVFSGRTSSVRRVQRYPSRASRQDIGVAPLLKTVLHKDISRSTYSVATNRSVKSHRKSNLNIPSSPTVIQSKFIFAPQTDTINIPYTPSPGNTPIAHSPLASNPLSAQDQTDETAANEKISSLNQDTLQPLSMPDKNVSDPASQNAPSSPTISRAPSDLNRSFRKRLLSGSSQTPSQYTSMGRLSYRPSIREQLQRNDLDNESLASTLVSHLQPQDALNPRYRLGSRSISSMMGSIASFPTALAIVKDDLARLEATDGMENKTVRDYFISFLDSLRLLRNKPFLVFISTCLLWALADSPFCLYLPAYAMRKGSSPMQASSLYTGMGFGSMCGRFLSGLVASDTDIGPILLHIGCLGVASMVAGLSPLFTDTYLQQLICAGLFGVYTGSLVPLSSLITIELLGIGELGLGFGFLSMAQGIGYLAGPPLLGVAIQAIGYEGSFVIVGIIFICASLLAMVIAILLRNAAYDEDLHDSFDDLERALRRISDTDSKDEGSDEENSHQDEDQHGKSPAFHGSLKKKEDLGTSLDDAPLHDGGGDRKDDSKLLPLTDENPTPASELETITEER
ncbi:unnamed protein product [Candidula unifasciata]|uniref:Major facilitator superfamily (MFS) profile domain-containing protein n=1 Tax=Candidula unifasciata TaxID=100452 RepID=A0A8S3ZQF4_9EUPU|nr:unnamed protein product [Candidula unifasciata]